MIEKRCDIMKKFICLIIGIIILISNTAFAFDAQTSSGNVILADGSGGIVLYEKNADAKFSPMHLTKIVTAMVVIENTKNLDEEITADPDIVNSSDFSFGNMGILSEETLTVRDLLYGMMLYDAGEAANLLADCTFGDKKEFVKKMNEYAINVGAESTNFVNANGKHNADQYTTARDMFKIVKNAMQNETFSKIAGTVMYTMEPTNKYKEKRYLSNKNALLSTYREQGYYYRNAIGVKSSYFDGTSHLASAAKRGNTYLICITANAKTDSVGNHAYLDAIELYKNGFENFSSIKFESRDDIIDEGIIRNGKNADRVLLVSGSDIFLGLLKDYDKEKLERKIYVSDKIKAPIKKGDALGSITYTYDGNVISKTSLVSSEDVKRDIIKGAMYWVKKVGTSMWFLVPAVVVLALIILRKMR